MLTRRILTTLVAALLLPLSMTAGPLCDLSCSLQDRAANCEMARTAAADNSNQAARLASRDMEMPPGMDMGPTLQAGNDNRVKFTSDQCPQCQHEFCTQDSLVKSVVPGVDRIQMKNLHRAVVRTLDLAPPSERSDWIQRESPPPKIEITFLSANLRI